MAGSTRAAEPEPEPQGPGLRPRKRRPAVRQETEAGLRQPQPRRLQKILRRSGGVRPVTLGALPVNVSSPVTTSKPAVRGRRTSAETGVQAGMAGRPEASTEIAVRASTARANASRARDRLTALEAGRGSGRAAPMMIPTAARLAPWVRAANHDSQQAIATRIAGRIVTTGPADFSGTNRRLAGRSRQGRSR